MIKTVRARHEAAARFTITTGSGHRLAVDDAPGDGPGDDPDALGERWPAAARSPAGATA